MLDFPAAHGRRKLREEFLKHAHVRDPRVIDMLVIKVCTEWLCMCVYAVEPPFKGNSE